MSRQIVRLCGSRGLVTFCPRCQEWREWSPPDADSRYSCVACETEFAEIESYAPPLRRKRIFPNGPYEFVKIHGVQRKVVTLGGLETGDTFAILHKGGVIEGPFHVDNHGRDGGQPWIDYFDEETK